jgi:hypothetical protein
VEQGLSYIRFCVDVCGRLVEFTAIAAEIELSYRELLHDFTESSKKEMAELKSDKKALACDIWRT